MSKEKAESKTACESTVNDAYLIVRNDNKLMKKSYRKNLIGVLSEMDDRAFSDIADYDAYDIKRFREIVRIADERGYLIYQLTRL